MKRFLAVFAIIALALSFTPVKSHAQVLTLKSQYGLTVDTVTTTEVKYLTLATPVTGYQKVLTVEFYAAEIGSVTTAASVQVQGSLDGTNYYNIGSAYTMTDVAAQVTSVKFTDFGDVYIRVKVTGTTGVNKIYAKVLARK